MTTRSDRFPCATNKGEAFLVSPTLGGCHGVRSSGRPTEGGQQWQMAGASPWRRSDGG